MREEFPAEGWSQRHQLGFQLVDRGLELLAAVAAPEERRAILAALAKLLA